MARQPIRAKSQAKSFQATQATNANHQRRRDPNRPMDVVVLKMKGIMGTLNAEQATIQVCGTNQTWHTVKGCLNSGATVTVTSVQLHEQFCSEVEHMHKLRDVILPNNARVRVAKQAKMYVRTRHVDD